MATITLRSVKGTPLTVAEVDANFNNLNTGKLETSNNLSDLTNTTTARTNLGVAIGTNVQAYDGDLDAIAAIAGTSGLLRKTAANTWSLDTTAYGTVASVALSLPAIFTVTGSPITTSGTLTATLASQTAKFVFAAPNAAAGAPSFRLLVPSDVSGLAASATTDTTNAANISSGTIGTARLATGTASATTYLRGDQAWVSLAASATSDTTNAANITSGTLVVARGGTGTSTTPSQGGVIYAASTAGYASTVAGTAGQVLTSNGISAPSWVSLGLVASATTDTTNASNITSGTLGTARLATGTASATTYLRGDQTWVSLAASATSDTTNAANISSGTLVVARGGTGTSTTPTQGGVIYAASTAGYASSAAGTAGQVLASNGAAAPSWLTIAASATTDTTNANNIVSGTLAIARGGTNGSATPTAGTVAYGTGTAFAFTAAGTAGQVITSNGATAPTWTAVVNSVTGTTNQVVTNASTGGITLSLPQSINTTASVQFGSFGVGTAASGTAGEIRATNNVSAFYSSDRKFKDNIQDISGAVEIVSAIGSKTFDWSKDYIDQHGGEDGYFITKSDFGVIAQDVQAVFPLAVRQRDDGSLAVNYEKLAILAFAAIKQQQTTIVNHQDRLSKLEALIEKLI